MSKILKNWLRLGRAQTWPADWLLVLVPFLHGSSNLVRAVLLSVFMWFVHVISFGENSVFDYTQGYDKNDPAKAHHPLEQGKISVHSAINVILWGKGLLMVIGALFTLWWSPQPLWSMFGLFMWYVWGTAYNLGLSKESLFGGLPISVCFTAMGGWAWLLSHSQFGTLGLLYLAFVFCTILFQISWSGHIKELAQKERSNILLKMGAKLVESKKRYRFSPHLEHIPYGTLVFHPGKAKYYGLTVKIINLLIAPAMLLQVGEDYRSLIVIPLMIIALIYLWKLTDPRIYDRAKELQNMGIEEIATIYLVLPILLGVPSIILMVIGVAYYFGVNKALWQELYPKV